MNMIVFGNGVFVDVIKLKILKLDHPQFAVVPKPSDWHPYKDKRTFVDTRRKRPCKDGGVHWNNAAPGVRTPRAVSSHRKFGEVHEVDSPSESTEETSRTGTLVWPL